MRQDKLREEKSESGEAAGRNGNLDAVAKSQQELEALSVLMTHRSHCGCAHMLRKELRGAEAQNVVELSCLPSDADQSTAWSIVVAAAEIAAREQTAAGHLLGAVSLM
eukprot:6200055-Pleurochrysis_carterae.AAC.1